MSCVRLCRMAGERFEPVPDQGGPGGVGTAKLLGLYVCRFCRQCEQWCPDPEYYPEFTCDSPPCPVYGGACQAGGGLLDC